MALTDIRIDSTSDVSIRQQLIEQVIYLIATGALTADRQLPSVRELARRLKIHHNTVSEAYQELVKREWVSRRRGSRLAVISRPTVALPGNARNLDEIINLTIHLAQSMGFSLQALRQRVRERLMSAAPDHILVIEQDPGLREILCEEIRSAQDFPVVGCSQQDLVANPLLAMGALAVAPVRSVRKSDDLFPKDRPVVPVMYSTAEEHIRMIQQLRQPSTIAVVSSSARFLSVARGILAPAIGTRHQLQEVLLSPAAAGAAPSSRGADLVFCDSIARKRLRSSKAIHYKLIAPESMESVIDAMKSYLVSISN